MTQKSLENVVRYMMATGGSTNSLLHIPALARQMGFDITPETFDAISREVPLISTIYPNHPVYTMEEFDRAGGLGAVVKEMVKAGKILFRHLSLLILKPHQRERKRMIKTKILKRARSLILKKIL